MSATRRPGIASIAAHIEATTHGIGRPRTYRTRRRFAARLRWALALTALVCLAWAHTRT